MSTLYRVNTSLTGEKGGMYSQFFQIREVLEYISWKLSDVVHAQVSGNKNNQLETQLETPTF